jgi:drug/metabolite transporter (DMT)-like permease
LFLWGFTAILGKLITVDALELVFFQNVFAAFFFIFSLGLWKTVDEKFPVKIFWQLIGVGGLMGGHWLCFFYSIKISNIYSFILSGNSNFICIYIGTYCIPKKSGLGELLLGWLLCPVCF